MKKTLLFAFAMLFATAMIAQNRAVLFEESFNGTSIPTGWSVNGLGTSNWSISPTHNAGGAVNELKLKDTPRFNGLSRFVSPVIDLTGYSGNIAIAFKHCLDNYSGSHPLGIATTSDGGSTWNQAWTQNYSADGVYNVTKMITTTDVGSSTFQFCITFSGDSYYINNWYFDDIQVIALESLDGRMLSVNVPEVSYGQEAGDLAATINFGMTMMNFGMTPITSVEATYEIEGMEPETQLFNSSIASLANQTFTFTETKTLLPGLYNVTITINKLNGEDDVFVDNNTMQKLFRVSMASEERIPMMEHFTASTCPYCPSANNQMATLCNNNPGRYTYTKYQMNWPGNGDPYYTEEGGVRRNYYEVSGVPSIYMDGTQTGVVNQNNFDQEASKPSCFDVTGSFSVNGNVVHVMADIAPYVDMEARVYISVNEKETFNNVGTNGETVFHHVMMKMLPDAEGTTINFVAGQNQHLEFTQNMTGTHVEEMSDLEVSIWVQNYDNKTIYNSRYAYEYTDVHPYPVENLTLTEADAPRGLLVAAWDAPTEGTPIGYNVYVNNALVAENITETEYAFEGDPEVFYVVGVVALYPNEQTSVKAVAVVSENLQDMGLIIPGSSNVILDTETPSHDLSVQNANFGTMTPIQINSITEGASNDGPYLNIELSSELPAMVEAGEEFLFTISPITMGGRSYASTSINVNYDGGVISFLVEIDGELLNVTELSSTAKIYPNPATDQVRIVSAKSIESVMVYNIMGALVETISVNDNNVNVNISQYNNGVYFFNIRQSDGTVSNQRVVVSH